ncbi:energy transducer TonB [Gracilimonas sp. Q87]|uniref:energy transducer TonB n=1 Tax=Gracilimonas sp. Q87 TaxID=3384766 RepID=UPI0039844727
MIALIGSLFIFLAIFKLWPASSSEEVDFLEFYSDEEILIDNAIITRQADSPPPPPKPMVPVPVPNDEIIPEDIEFPDIEDVFAEESFSELPGRGETSGKAQLVGNPQSPPMLLKIVEPTIPQAVKDQNIKAQIDVTFLVGADGNVEDAFISEIRLFDGDSYKIVDQIGYGLLEATIEAATKWKFSPPRDNGEPVRTYVQNSFNIGF